jgi:site-specific DNA recombinase
MRVPAGDVEGLVLDRLKAFFSSRIEVSDALAPLELDARTLDAALCNAARSPLAATPTQLWRAF